MRLSVLGPLTVQGREGKIPVNSPTQRSILAFLAVHANRVVTPEQILEAVWGDDQPSGGRRTLAYHISKLRDTLEKGGDPDAVKTISGGYSLQIDTEDLDSLAFEALHAEASAQQGTDPAAAAGIAAHGLELWKGADPYSDLRYESYLQTEIQRLLDKKVACAELAFRGKVASGSANQVIEAVPPLLEQSPFNEGLHGIYMEALAAAGRRIEALRHYDAYAEMLAEETGNTPQADLQALADKLVADEEPRQLLRGTNLPASITPLIGRRSDLKRLTAIVGEHRYVDVLGPGGIGKTRLAVEAVRQVIEGNGAIGWFIDLSRTHDSVIGAVADTLGLKDRPGEDLRDVVCRAVGTTEALFVFDSCEAFVAEVGSLAKDLLQHCPNTRVVTTSRFVTDEVAAASVRVSPMTAGNLSDDGPRLFLARATAVGARLDQSGEDTAIQIVRLLEGIPLAIELAASQLASRSIDDLHASLVEGGVRALDESLAATGDGPLWRMLGSSFELLDAEDADHLRHVAAFSGGFTAAEAGDLVGTPPRRADALLQRLNHRSLIVAEPGLTPTQYRVLEAVRDYVADLNSADGLATEVAELHIRWCEDLTRNCRRRILDDQTVPGFVSGRLANLRSAIDRLEESGDADRLARLVSRLDLFWVISGRAAEGLRHLRRAMDIGGLTLEVQPIAYNSAGLLASIDRDYEQAEVWFEHALELGEHAPHVVPLVFANRARSRTAQAFSGRAPDAEEMLAAAGEDFEVALIFFEAAGLDGGLVTTLPFAEWHAILIGEPLLAEIYCERTLAIAKEHGYGWSGAVALAIRGLLRLTESEPAAAMPDLKEAESGFEAWGDRYSMQITESFNAAAQLQLGDVETAVGAITQALLIMETQGSREWEAMTTGIALALLQEIDAPIGVRSSCQRWLDSNHHGWRGLLATVGLEVEPLRPDADAIAMATASQIARECRRALEQTPLPA